MAAVLTDDVMDVREAHEDLDTILESIAQERGVRVALGAAAAVRTAIEAGAISGSHYRAVEAYTDSWGEHIPARVGACIIGHIATYLGVNERGNIHFPGYVGDRITPLESFVMHVRAGHTPADTDELATVASWLDSWTRQRS